MAKRLVFLSLAFFMMACQGVEGAATGTPASVTATAALPTAEPATAAVPTETVVALTQTTAPMTTLTPVTTIAPMPFEIDASLAYLEFHSYIDDVPVLYGNNYAFVRFLGKSGHNVEIPLFLQSLTKLGMLSASPDGTKLALIEAQDRGWAQSPEITGYIVDLFANESTQMNLSGGYINSSANNFSWSPDSQKVVFALEPQRRPKLHIWDQVNRQLYPLMPEAHNSTEYHLYPSWSPNGTWIAFVRYVGSGGYPLRNGERGALCIVHPDGTGLQVLDEAAYLYTGDWSDFMPPAWSPDGRWIAYLAGDIVPTIRLHNVETGESRWLTDGSIPGLFPAWSPDGGALAFVSMPTLEGRKDLYRVSFSGQDLVQLTRDAGTNVLPRWSPTGRFIVFLSNREEQYETAFGLYGMTSNGSNQTRLTPASVLQPPIWLSTK